MISRTAFCSAQAAVIRSARTGPMPSTSRRRSASVSMTSNTRSPKAPTSFFAYTGPIPRIIPEPRYLSMPSVEVGAEAFRNRDRNCGPQVRSFTHSPEAVIHSPAETVAAWPTTVTSSRWPRALTRRTQKPLSSPWKVTRSTEPASTSRSDDGDSCFMVVRPGCRSRPIGRESYFVLRTHSPPDVMLPESMTDSACRDFDARTGERPEPPPPYTRCERENVWHAVRLHRHPAGAEPHPDQPQSVLLRTMTTERTPWLKVICAMIGDG